MGQISTKFRENFYYPFVYEENYVYDESLISKSFIRRKNQIVQLYHDVYQYNIRNNCYLSNQLEKYIFGLIKKFAVIQLISTGTVDKMNKALIIMNNVKVIHDTYFGNKFDDMHSLRRRINNDFDLLLNDIYNSYETINNIETDELDLLNPDMKLVKPTFTILQITQIIREMLRLLKRDISAERDDNDDFYRRFALNRAFSHPNYRKWNHNQFLQNHITPNITIMDIKVLDIEKENINLAFIISDNFTSLIRNATNDARMRQQCQNQIEANLKKMYTNYRFNRFSPSN